MSTHKFQIINPIKKSRVYQRMSLNFYNLLKHKIQDLLKSNPLFFSIVSTTNQQLAAQPLGLIMYYSVPFRVKIQLNTLFVANS